jgi:hypothetical protein
VIACRGANHTALCGGLGEVSDFVVGAAQLEGKHGLQIFALEQHGIAEPRAETGSELEWRFNSHIVDARLEDAFEIVVRHRMVRSMESVR